MQIMSPQMHRIFWCSKRVSLILFACSIVVVMDFIIPPPIDPLIVKLRLTIDCECVSRFDSRTRVSIMSAFSFTQCKIHFMIRSRSIDDHELILIVVKCGMQPVVNNSRNIILLSSPIGQVKFNISFGSTR